MSVVNHILNETKIAALKKVLANRTEKGKPVDYEIRVDKLPVVQRTNDIERFEAYKEFFSESTSEISVLLYEGHSRNNTQHLFIRHETIKQEQGHSYGGKSLEDIIKERVDQEKRLWENEKLQEDNVYLKKKIEKLKKEKEELKDEFHKLEEKLRKGEKDWGHIISYGAEGLLRRCIPLIAKIPGAEGLTELWKPEEQQRSTDNSAKEQKSQPESTEQVLTKDSPESLNTVKVPDKEFSKEKAISEILVSLDNKPESPKPTQPFLSYGTVKKQIRNILKMGVTQLNGSYNSAVAWIKQNYKLISHFMKTHII